MEFVHDEDGVSVDLDMDEACEFYMWLHKKSTSRANQTAHEFKFQLYRATKNQPIMQQKMLRKKATV